MWQVSEQLYLSDWIKKIYILLINIYYKYKHFLEILLEFLIFEFANKKKDAKKKEISQSNKSFKKILWMRYV